MSVVSILGLGLMGGSLGLALKARGLAERVRGYARREETRQRALAAGAVDTAADRPEDAVRGADCVVLCVPVLSIPAVAAACLPALAPGCVVTDVGSTKAWLAGEMARLFAASPARFVGSHPIAGSDRTGLEAARANLYEGATVVVTPGGTEGETDAAEAVSRLWTSVGARIVRMAPDAHDRVIARTSHLPHVVAAMLVEAVWSGVEPEGRALCGSGFRDATRIAGGSEELWHDIVKSNRAALLDALGEFGAIAATVKQTIESGDFEGLREFLARNRRRRGEVLP
jgi:prephenate dehydrogenase